MDDNRKRQYEDSAKITGYALLALGVIVTAAIINNLIFILFA